MKDYFEEKAQELLTLVDNDIQSCEYWEIMVNKVKIFLKEIVRDQRYACIAQVGLNLNYSNLVTIGTIQGIIHNTDLEQ